ncbi:MAG: hypothetical protein HFP81_08230 [Methylococcales symbiont of Hymedesmia sp. n. MRB-2018]|nr:MAG: hypothetical protein HFP78_08465 [Methylococcales symbiont of Hymedesmia sp. n. MRB-2018]KAF3983344.1 MAG: hypothetical protein HFP81_08230 [Methylococcales symbiont of Hymedesmia sp. n. MRB-2018]
MPTTISRLIVTAILLVLGFLFSTLSQASEHITADHIVDDFVTQWRIPAGDAVARTIVFPSTGNYNINWGDGMVEDVKVSINEGGISHTYDTADNYTVVVSNAINRFIPEESKDTSGSAPYFVSRFNE